MGSVGWKVRSLPLWAFWVALLGSVPAQAATLHWANDGDIVATDPYNFQETFALGFLGNVYDTLVTRDQELKIVPALAESWKLVDPNTWEFKLRRGIKFHDGSPLTSADVVFSYRRIMSPGSDLKSVFASVATVEAKDPYTVVIRTKEPNPILLAYLTIFDILSQSWAEANKATEVTDLRKGTENYATRHANGTGAYILVSREPDVKTVLKRNPEWWGWKAGLGKSNIDEVVFTPIKQDSTRLAAMVSGDVDMMYSLAPQDIDRVKQIGLKVYQRPEVRTIYLQMDQKRDELLESDVKGKNPFKDHRVRLALYKAIDEDAIVSKIMRGAALAATVMVVPEVTGFDPKAKRLGYDPAEAQRLLAEAGYPNGFSIGFDCPNDRYVNDALICSAIVSMWAKVGIKANLATRTKSLHFAKVLKRDTTTFLAGWSPVTLDALNAIDNSLLPLNADGTVGRGNMGYSSAKVEALAQQARGELDANKRTRMLQEALDQALADVATIPLHYQQVLWASSPNIDLVQRADNVFNWYWVTKK
jgi:peptide/nickel transport system substrate-binding protein